MSDKTIKEHYVPQRYLKKFANNKKFYVYDKKKDEKRPGNIGDYACERFFYDIDFEVLTQHILEQNTEFEFEPEIQRLIGQVDPQHIEHWFSEYVETWLFNPIDSIISTYTLGNPNKIDEIEILTEDKMNYLSLYLAIQIVRTKEFRENIVDLCEKIPLLIMKKLSKDTVEGKFLDSIKLKIMDENYEKLIHAQFLMNQDLMTYIAMLLRKKIWFVGINDSQIDFLTSDNPVVRYGHKGMYGFNSEGIEIAFPINSRLVLILKDPIFFSNEVKYHKHFLELGVNEVRFYNSLQAIQSSRYVFDKSGSFHGIGEIIRDINRNKLDMI